MNERTNKEWQDALAEPVVDEAITDLRAILLRGLRYALTNHRVTEADLEDFVQDGLLRMTRCRLAARVNVFGPNGEPPHPSRRCPHVHDVQIAARFLRTKLDCKIAVSYVV